MNNVNEKLNDLDKRWSASIDRFTEHVRKTLYEQKDACLSTTNINVIFNNALYFYAQTFGHELIFPLEFPFGEDTRLLPQVNVHIYPTEDRMALRIVIEELPRADNDKDKFRDAFGVIGQADD